jgi:hypothetical protein
VRVSVERGGGLSGLTKIVSVDTEKLAPGDAERVAALVSDAGRLQPSQDARLETSPDDYSYVLIVEEGEQTREETFSPRLMPESVHRLITLIEGVDGHTETIRAPGS